MAKEAEFNFIPEHQLNSKSSDPEFRVSITASGMLYFPREIVEIYELDKKLFKFYADLSKKAIAWKSVDGVNLADLSGYRKLGIVNSGAGQISVMKLLSALRIKDLRGSITQIPVRTYKGGGYLAEEVNYIIVNEKDAKERRRGGRELENPKEAEAPQEAEGDSGRSGTESGFLDTTRRENTAGGHSH